MKNDRLFQILYILLDKRSVTAIELAKKLEVSVRTIYRDIDTLSEAGVPVYASKGRGGGIHLMEDFTVDRSMVSDAEQDEMLFALQSLKAAGHDTSDLILKLAAIFKKENKDWIEVDFSRWGHKKEDKSKFEIIKDAIINRKIVHISYFSSYGENTSRDIKPVKLIFKNSSWYVQAFCIKAGGFRLFKVNRIIDILHTGSFFYDDFSNVPHIDDEPWDMKDAVNLKLRISKDMSFRAYDEFSSENIEKSSDGSIIVSVKMPKGEWIYSYILDFGENVKVIEPPYLKEGLKKYIEKIYNHL